MTELNQIRQIRQKCEDFDQTETNVDTDADQCWAELGRPDLAQCLPTFGNISQAMASFCEFGQISTSNAPVSTKDRPMSTRLEPMSTNT